MNLIFLFYLHLNNSPANIQFSFEEIEKNIIAGITILEKNRITAKPKFPNTQYSRKKIKPHQITIP